MFLSVFTLPVRVTWTPFWHIYCEVRWSRGPSNWCVIDQSIDVLTADLEFCFLEKHYERGCVSWCAPVFSGLLNQCWRFIIIQQGDVSLCYNAEIQKLKMLLRLIDVLDSVVEIHCLKWRCIFTCLESCKTTSSFIALAHVSLLAKYLETGHASFYIWVYLKVEVLLCQCLFHTKPLHTW